MGRDAFKADPRQKERGATTVKPQRQKSKEKMPLRLQGYDIEIQSLQKA